jgi:hypothetical protein
LIQANSKNALAKSTHALAELRNAAVFGANASPDSASAQTKLTNAEDGDENT